MLRKLNSWNVSLNKLRIIQSIQAVFQQLSKEDVWASCLLFQTHTWRFQTVQKHTYPSIYECN